MKLNNNSLFQYDDNWMQHSITWLDNTGKVKIDYRPVILKTLSDEMETVPPIERVY